MESQCQNEWSRDLSPKNVALLTASAVRRQLHDGETLHAVGDEAEGIYGIARGRIRYCVMGNNGQEVLITLYEAGNWFGEVSVLDGKYRRHDARAIGETEILLVPRARFLVLLQEHPELYPALVQMLCHKIRFALDEYENSLFLPLNVRLARRCLELVRAYGKPATEGITLDLHLPQEELARMVHAARQSVNRELKTWEKSGWVSMRYGRMVVLDSASLQKIAFT